MEHCCTKITFITRVNVKKLLELIFNFYSLLMYFLVLKVKFRLKLTPTTKIKNLISI